MDNFPSIKEFWKGVNEFRRHERRDAMYKVATRILKDYWGKYEEVTDGLGVLLLTWNQALYRYGIFDFDKLEQFLKKHDGEINDFRERSIITWVKQDDMKVKCLFAKALDALISERKDGILRKSPVAVAKALHLLAPDFFPLWDIEIARGYRCYWYNSETSSEKYIYFCKEMIDFYQYLKKNKIRDDKGMTLLKLIDEYNYSKYTKKWVT